MSRIKRDIIDNITENITMQDILNSEIPQTTQLDISTGYFNVGGYALLKDRINEAIKKDNYKMRLLLGKQALLPDDTFEDIVQRNSEDAVSLKTALNDEELSIDTLSDTSSLISILKRDNIQVRLGTTKFNHSKCYIMDYSVFIGSSNFTAGGLVGNFELNAGLYQPGVVDTTREWFERMWNLAKDTKQDLIDLLESSKFGKPDTPYNIYIKMIFERYRDMLIPDTDDPEYKGDLTTFQKDAVRTALFIISEYKGAMISDATGLGKTNMGMEILRQKILKEKRKVLLIAPSQVLKSMWEKKLKEASLSVSEDISTEMLGRKEILDKSRKYDKIDFVLIDESQNFRSKNANRSQNLAKIMASGKPKQALLLTATPINNSIMDLYHQIRIITKNKDEYFWKLGIPSLYQHMRDAANKEGGLAAGLEKIQRLLDGIMVRRTRSYIKEVYPEDTINGNPVKFPEHEYSPIHYSLADLYGNVFQRILDDMHKLTMAPYGIEQYNTEIPDEEKRKHRVLAHLQVILLLKRFESSVVAVKTSLENKIRLYQHIQKVVNEGRMVKVRELNKILAKGNRGDLDEDKLDEFILKEVQKSDIEPISKKYDIEQFKSDLSKDLDILEELQEEISKVTADKKLEAVRDTIIKDEALFSESRKILIFTEYTTTANYLKDKLLTMFPENKIELITGDTKTSTRTNLIERFAPESNLEDGNIEKEIDMLVSTEVLAEGQNLQDCNYVINYDLPWNPMRIVQRIGRIDRLTSKYDVVHSRACYPDKELDGILELMGKLLNKIHTVDKVIGLDAELLGETPTPKQYNGHLKDRLKILGDGGQSATEIIVQMGRDAELVPANTPFNEISKYVKKIGIEELKAMPIGRRGGKAGSSKRCILAYLREKPNRHVYFVIYDYSKDLAYVPDNEYDAVNEARCNQDEPSYMPMDKDDPSESFKQLLEIDRKAREAIKLNDNKLKNYIGNKSNTSYEKIRKEVKRTLSDIFNTGKADAERIHKVNKIAKRTELQAWEDDLKDMVDRYNDDSNLEQFLSRIEDIGERIGVEEENISEQIEIDYTNLKLIGALFTLPKDDSGSKNTIISHVK